jgi:hypothetical protein
MSDTTARVSLNNTDLDLKIRNFKILNYFIDCRNLQLQNHVLHLHWSFILMELILSNLKDNIFWVLNAKQYPAFLAPVEMHPYTYKLVSFIPLFVVNVV